MNTQQHSVQIFVAEHCANCVYSREIAQLIGDEFPEIRLDVIDVHASDVAIPDSVFATPTYLLNGKVWSLGNPYPEDVRRTLSDLIYAVA